MSAEAVLRHIAMFDKDAYGSLSSGEARDLVAELDRLRQSARELRWIERGLAPLCPCSTGGPNFEGPLRECPVHGDGDTFVAEVRELRERVAQQERITERALAANVELRARVSAFEAVARRLLAAHDPGYVSLMQEDADELRRLLGERA